MLTPETLQGKVALVTGAGRGLGQAVALAYARQGARVIITGRTESELNRTAAMIRDGGGEVLAETVDVSDDAAMTALADEVRQRFGRLDVLMNNAGQLLLKSFAEMTLAEWDNILAVNLRGTVLGCKLFLPLIGPAPSGPASSGPTSAAAGGGSIINVSSNAGVSAFPLESAYCASKFAIEGFSRVLAVELQERNIAVNTVTPGKLPGGATIKPTSLTQAQFEALSHAEQSKWADGAILTEAFIFLALQRGDGVTGQRVPAYELSDHIRRHGWDVNYRAASAGWQSSPPSDAQPNGAGDRTTIAISGRVGGASE